MKKRKLSSYLYYFSLCIAVAVLFPISLCIFIMKHIVSTMLWGYSIFYYFVFGVKRVLSLIKVDIKKAEKEKYNIYFYGYDKWGNLIRLIQEGASFKDCSLVLLNENIIIENFKIEDLYLSASGYEKSFHVSPSSHTKYSFVCTRKDILVKRLKRLI